MNGEHIFEGLNYLEDQYIIETQEYLKQNKNSRKKHFLFYKIVAAAVIAAVVSVSGTMFFFHWSKSNDEKMVADFEKEINQDTKICIDEKIYQITSQIPVSDLSSEYKYVGIIQSNVSSNLNPQKNLEANAKIVGSKVYQSDEMIAVQADGTEKYWIFQKEEDLVYRKYNTGFDIDCSDGEEVVVYWNYNTDKLKQIYLYGIQQDQRRELTTEEMENRSITITLSGHYFLYGIDRDGKTIDLTEYLSMEYKDVTHIDSENKPIVGL